MFTVLHRFSYVEMLVAFRPSCITEDAMLDVLSTASATYVSPFSFRAIQCFRNGLFHVSLRHRQMTVMTSGITGKSSLFNSLFKLATKKHQMSALMSLCMLNPPVTGGFPHRETVTRKIFPSDDVKL